jgi:predicted N-formylglutamate amidohydrolase
LDRLLYPDEPACVTTTHAHATSRILLTCDHAGNLVPRALDNLGVTEAELARHIGWDIGAAGVTEALADLLDATAILQTYSRLVIDCNRRPGHPTSVAPVSDGTHVPGNQGAPPAWLAARIDEIFNPYHAAIATEIDARLARGAPPAVIAVHSFTPIMAGEARIWQAGVLHNHDPRLALALLALLRAEGLTVGDNEPYALSDDSDYTIPVHAERRGLLNLELEIRQDLIATQEGQRHWAALLARLLPEALSLAAR